MNLPLEARPSPAPSCPPARPRLVPAPADRPDTPHSDTGWPESLLDRWFDAWARRAEARWVREASRIPTPYY
ncbi:hypothetical protein [Caldimonas tepidiphila]|uniref:hypothetical protein n=1 Tax=Caldimonas tepidiphila TaxID=2315841 RepID=UPI001474EF35|nr:hypothetical protein [Caldimonas tepidiphila]